MTETANKEAYTSSDLNVELFAGRTKSLNDYFPSMRHFFTPQYVRDGDTILDVGGASGDFCSAIKNDVANVKATIIDPDPKAISVGRETYPDFEHIEGFFPQSLEPNQKFDIVTMQALFAQIPTWKETLLAMRKHARRYINMSLAVRLSGTTVIDKDVSYFYYLDSGERVHQVIHNIYEIVNFMCIHEMNAKKISFFGYHVPRQGHNFRCLPNSEVVHGNFMIELFENEADNPKRMGGAADKGIGNSNYHYFEPEFDIVIDGKPFGFRDA